MRIESNIYIKLLHSFSGLLYLLPCYELFSQNNKLGYLLYLVVSFTSFIWSLTSYGGNNGYLVKIDVYTSYLVIVYNYYKSLNWITNKYWSNYQTNGFILTHLSGAIFIIENILIKNNIYPKISYFVLHFLWRLFSSIGSYYIFLK